LPVASLEGPSGGGRCGGALETQGDESMTLMFTTAETLGMKFEKISRKKPESQLAAKDEKEPSLSGKRVSEGTQKRPLKVWKRYTSVAIIQGGNCPG